MFDGAGMRQCDICGAWIADERIHAAWHASRGERTPERPVSPLWTWALSTPAGDLIQLHYPIPLKGGG